MTCVRGMPGSV